ncbi:MAG: T9SS type A sorting domain-containing protein [Crocinitomicaceae bacterium]|nr:T9SS type A sorting domain-containing protein [Crocinitomicaceae bacterium]
MKFLVVLIFFIITSANLRAQLEIHNYGVTIVNNYFNTSSPWPSFESNKFWIVNTGTDTIDVFPEIDIVYEPDQWWSSFHDDISCWVLDKSATFIHPVWYSISPSDSTLININYNPDQSDGCAIHHLKLKESNGNLITELTLKHVMGNVSCFLDNSESPTDDLNIKLTVLHQVLNISSNKNLTNCSFQIYDLSGNLLHTEPIYTNYNQVDLSALSSGIYLVKITSNHGTIYSDKIALK